MLSLIIFILFIAFILLVFNIDKIFNKGIYILSLILILISVILLSEYDSMIKDEEEDSTNVTTKYSCIENYNNYIVYEKEYPDKLIIKKDCNSDIISIKVLELDFNNLSVGDTIGKLSKYSRLEKLILETYE